jgi:glycosyltransferase involved in cell wall biosynthesis
VRIAFYAPMKPPGHPVPSGDRRVAEYLVAALEAAEHTVEIASTFRSYEGIGEAQHQTELRAAGGAEAGRVTARLAVRPMAERPTLWFTYHVYHKSPDWLGPAVARSLRIPYVIAEPSYAAKQAGGPWASGLAAARQAIEAADALICPTRLDMAAVTPLTQPGRVHYLPPFLDAAPFVAARADRAAARAKLARCHELDPERVWLLAVGMMRRRDKLESYQRLAAALARLQVSSWRLLVVGDGEARAEVAAALARFGDKVRFLGELAPAQLARIYGACDIYVWPAAGEAYGMALLEAQAAGLPVVAGRVRGVPDVVQDRLTGLLAAENDPADFATMLSPLIEDSALRYSFGVSAAQFVAGERTIAAAGVALDTILRPLVTAATS